MNVSSERAFDPFVPSGADLFVPSGADLFVPSGADLFVPELGRSQQREGRNAFPLGKMGASQQMAPERPPSLVFTSLRRETPNSVKNRRYHQRARPPHAPFRTLSALVAAALLSAGCTNGGVLRAAVPTTVPAVTASPSPVRPPDPRPLTFPLDEGPHDRLTEWWYYTGHLETDQGRDFGFEFVVFRAERGAFPVAWASHFAVTDATAGTFLYDQRTEYGPQVDTSPAGGGFDLAIHASQPAAGGSGSSPMADSWTMRRSSGRDHLSAVGSPGRIDLDLTTQRPPVLHDGDGWVDLGPAGGTYYYSRTRLEVVGTFAPPGGGTAIRVHGLAWFDHQWGDFIAVGAGGWDWFSVQLDDGRDLTISLVHGPGGVEVLDYGTIVAADGSARHLGADDFRIAVLERWKSPHTGADYPAEWRIELPKEALTLQLTPTLADQELDTTTTTGAIYWEGEVTVSGTNGAGGSVAGRGYVELTGYAT